MWTFENPPPFCLNKKWTLHLKVNEVYLAFVQNIAGALYSKWRLFTARKKLQLKNPSLHARPVGLNAIMSILERNRRSLSPCCTYFALFYIYFIFRRNNYCPRHIQSSKHSSCIHLSMLSPWSGGWGWGSGMGEDFYIFLKKANSPTPNNLWYYYIT